MASTGFSLWLSFVHGIEIRYLPFRLTNANIQISIYSTEFLEKEKKSLKPVQKKKEQKTRQGPVLSVKVLFPGYYSVANSWN